MLELEFDLDAIKKNKELPDPIKQRLYEISRDELISFDDVKKYLDEVSIATLQELEKDIEEIIEANGVITKEEEIAKDNFVDYLNKRIESEQVYE